MTSNESADGGRLVKPREKTNPMVHWTPAGTIKSSAVLAISAPAGSEARRVATIPVPALLIAVLSHKTSSGPGSPPRGVGCGFWAVIDWAAVTVASDSIAITRTYWINLGILSFPV